MEYILLLIGTIAVGIFCVLVMMSDHEDMRSVLIGLVTGYGAEIRDLECELTENDIRAAKRGEQESKKHEKKQLRVAKKLKNKMKVQEQAKQGKGIFSALPALAGFSAIRIMKIDNGNGMLKQISRQCEQLEDRQIAMIYAKYIFATLIGWLILAAAILFPLTGLFLATGLGMRGVVIAVVFAALAALIGYLPASNLKVMVQKRAQAIEAEFPEAASKMALLTLSGMGALRVWRMTAESNVGVLYYEMQRVAKELDNNVTAARAYEGFIRRCNNKFTTKLATAMLQSTSKGNDEIAVLFRELNSESWMERSHNARRMGSVIQSKLMIPTLIMFLGIIILVVVPMLGSFNI